MAKIVLGFGDPSAKSKSEKVHGAGSRQEVDCRRPAEGCERHGASAGRESE